jgi:uncharacterized protein
MEQNLGLPLSDFEFDRLAMILGGFRGDDAISTLEGVDGFFAALLCSPSLVMPSEYLPEIWGGDLHEQESLPSACHVEELVTLLTRHWNAMACSFSSDEFFVPLILKDERGQYLGNNWAKGFLRGMELRREEWGVLFENEEDAAAVAPIFILAHEHDPDPEMRSEPVPEEKRDDLAVFLVTGVNHIYRFFASRRHAPATTRVRKVGRNEACPCGSGVKYKKCCGRMTVQ